MPPRFWPILLVLGLLACTREDGEASRPRPVRARPEPAAARVPEPVLGDAARGREIVARFECNRCHDGTGMRAAPLEKHCTRCHEQIVSRSFPAPAAALERWHGPVEPYRDAPSLEALGRRLKPEWVVRFLERPYDVRPHLAASMPRLPLSREQAQDVAAYLTSARYASVTNLDDADQRRGRELIEQKGCGSCHELSGVPALPQRPNPALGSDDTRRAIGLAPDLRHTRDRFAATELVEWLVNPGAVKPGTRMPSFALSYRDARDIAGYLLQAELAAPSARALPERLPLLTRAVSYEELERRVFRQTCRHCHGNPEQERGDGGPGNTGGFGFAPRGLDLSSYRGVMAGLLVNGERQSAFRPGADGTPLLLASLVARQREEAGLDAGPVRGMPLGLPALSAEQVQLVESWIAQGRPR